jgi:PAS domain S-box-containing protein
MRQNMEELKATQEESTRREEEFRGVAEAIEKALMVIEYNLEGRIHEVNESFCSFIGKAHDDIIGKFHNEIIGGSLNTDSAFWNELHEKGHLNITEIVKVGKKTIEILEHFAPVTNRNNAIVKYINFATDGRTGNR